MENFTEDATVNAPPEEYPDFPDTLDSPRFQDAPRKEYPKDPNFPDINSAMYKTDEFRMFGFKIIPCSRVSNHSWPECPFAHPGENARRRDPRRFHYSSVPCQEYKDGGLCRQGDMCGYAHGVFESHLHPSTYKTQMCKDGLSCDRRVCFFAHRREELRPRSDSAASVSTGFPQTIEEIASRNWAQQKAAAAASLHSAGATNFQNGSLVVSVMARGLNINSQDLQLMAEFDSLHRSYLNNLATLSVTNRAAEGPSSSSSSRPPLVRSPLAAPSPRRMGPRSPVGTNLWPRPPLVQSPLAGSSPRRMGPVETQAPMRRDKQPMNNRSHSSRELRSRSYIAIGPRRDQRSNLRSSANREGSSLSFPSRSGPTDPRTEELQKSEYELPFDDDPELGWVNSLTYDGDAK